jgi:hypothetical protein
VRSATSRGRAGSTYLAILDFTTDILKSPIAVEQFGRRRNMSGQKKRPVARPKVMQSLRRGTYAVHACVSIHIIAPTFVIAKIIAGTLTPSAIAQHP